jgi:hypothetical protein
MNERIKQLAEQAGMYDFVLEAMGIGEEFEKFAELIVKESMDVVAKKCASPTAYNALVEHWGVEE